MVRLDVHGCALAVALSGCGGHDTSTASAASSGGQAARTGPSDPRRLAARLGEFTIGVDRRTAPRGRVTFVIHDAGKLQHEFVVLKTDHAADALPREGNEVKEHRAGRLVDEAEDIDAGKTVRLKVRLEPGTYVLICNLPGHYASRMRAALRVI